MHLSFDLTLCWTSPKCWVSLVSLLLNCVLSDRLMDWVAFKSSNLFRFIGYVLRSSPKKPDHNPPFYIPNCLRLVKIWHAQVSRLCRWIPGYFTSSCCKNSTSIILPGRYISLFTVKVIQMDFSFIWLSTCDKNLVLLRLDRRYREAISESRWTARIEVSSENVAFVIRSVVGKTGVIS